MKKRYTLFVTGHEYHQPALSSLAGEKNFEWSMTKNELIDELDLDERVYQYEKADYPLAIRHEPGNRYDPAALRVYADDVFVGYVPRGNLGTLQKMSMLPGLEMSVEIYGGPYKELVYNEDDDFFGDMEPKYFSVRTVQGPFRAIMVFSWNA